MAVERKLMTAEEFFRLPSDDTFQELVRGEVHTSPPPGGPHGVASNEIGSLIGSHVRAHRSGWVFNQSGFRVEHDPDTVRAPDIAFVAAARLPAGHLPEGYADLVPDLVVEVVSPSDTAAEVQERMQDWLRWGARLAWLAYPRTQSVAIYEPGEAIRLLGPDDTIDGGAVLPGFTCLVRDFFPG